MEDVIQLHIQFWVSETRVSIQALNAPHCIHNKYLLVMRTRLMYLKLSTDSKIEIKGTSTKCTCADWILDTQIDIT